MEGWVKEPDGNGEAVHYRQDFLKVAPLHGEEGVQCLGVEGLRVFKFCLSFCDFLPYGRLPVPWGLFKLVLEG